MGLSFGLLDSACHRDNPLHVIGTTPCSLVVNISKIWLRRRGGAGRGGAGLLFCVIEDLLM